MSDMPDLQIQELPKEAVDNIKAIEGRARESSDSLNRSAMFGAEDSAKLLDRGSFDNQLAYGNDALSHAIGSRASMKYANSMNRLKSETSLDAVNRKFNRLGQAAELVGQELQYNERVKQMRYMQSMHRKQARASALGSILGVAGAIVGGVVTMSPAGAAAGYGVGSGIGNAIGGDL